METHQIWILAGLVVVVLCAAEHLLEDFRKKVKEGDVAGIKFNSELVLNRRIIKASRHHVVVWDATMTFQMTLPKEIVYAPSREGAVDERFTHEERIVN